MAIIKKFKAVLENPEKEMDIAFVFIPFDLKKEFGSSRVKVKATFDKHPYRGMVVNMVKVIFWVFVRIFAMPLVNKWAM